MTTTVKAIYENGVFKPNEPADLREKTEVSLKPEWSGRAVPSV